VKKVVRIVALAVLLLPAILMGIVWWKLQPRAQSLPLPEHLVEIDSVQGQALLESADHIADYDELAAAFVPQSLISYCGVASAVAALGALGTETTQTDFFTSEASQVRSRWQVALGGMSLIDLEGLLSAYQVDTERMHGDAMTLDEFRRVVESNLSREGDFLLVNYQREALGQGRVGHISPIAAYDSATERVLIMDTASYKYPHTWVPLDLLFAAMQEADNATGRARGYLEVGRAETSSE
jgi:hypothetical protein